MKSEDDFFPRGSVRNEAQYTQPKDYSHLRYGKITPSDIDGFIDFKNVAFVFLELKHQSAGLEGGQRLAYERICDACEDAGRKSIVIVAHHNCEPPEMIPVHALQVTECRYRKKWWPPMPPGVTVKEFLDRFFKFAVVGNDGSAAR